jgi:hypothetical protein
MGGKDEFGIPTNDVEEFGLKEVKSTMQADWKIPAAISGFSTCQIADRKFVIAGGNNG